MNARRPALVLGLMLVAALAGGVNTGTHTEGQTDALWRLAR